MTFSHATLLTFAELLDQVQLPATHPHLVEAAQQLATARTELQAALAEAAAAQATEEREPEDGT